MYYNQTNGKIVVKYCNSEVVHEINLTDFGQNKAKSLNEGLN